MTLSEYDRLLALLATLPEAPPEVFLRAVEDELARRRKLAARRRADRKHANLQPAVV